MTDQPETGFSWRNRRRVIFLTLTFCAFVVGYIVFRGKDDELNRAALLYLTSLAGATVGSYVFGAAWENVRGQK